MQINLINGFYIDTDNRNFTLKQKYIGTRKDGTKKEAVKIISHCGILEQALDLFLRINQVPKEAKMAVDLMSYADFIEQSNKEAVQALKSVLECKESDDDLCKWNSVSEGEFIRNPHTNRLYSNEQSMKNIYCNTCGKKIKVVDNHEVN